MPETLSEFTEQRRASWSELGALVERAGGRVTRLGEHDVHRLGLRYREAVADLSVARRRFPAEATTRQLDRLVGQARPLVYGSVRAREPIAHFAATGYWRRVRERPAFLLVAAIALWGPMLVMGLWSHANPDRAARVAQVSPLTAGLGEGAPRDPDTQKETDLGVNAAFSSEIFTNNARVALIAYAGGLTGGVLTLAALVFNGALVGLVFGLAIEGGYSDSVWRLILPHGVIELSLITVAGAAGLRTGWAIVHPGHRTRSQALAVEGRAGIEMAVGTAVILVPVGLVEGFVTVRGLSMPMAIVVGVGLGALYWGLVWWRGRPDLTSEPVTAERSP